ncbi:MAG TPA: M14 family metallopeptidase, partial [Bryobacteraceae bacterium]|nr:M14 family metallopeptidase [Bryobacteraceae bacterium]
MKPLTLFALTAMLSVAQIPTPESVLGHKPGDDFYLATYEDALGYFKKLAASSKRIKLVQVGKTTQGRDWYIAFVSTPENLAQLDHYKEVSRRLGLSRGVSDAEARKLAHDQKAIIHIDGGLHATEVACAQHMINLGYELVASEEPEYKNIRENVIAELWFSINPDGQTMVANWYRQNLGTPYEVSATPFLWQEYVGHDNNRDGYMLNMLESQVVTKATLDTQPLVFYTHHQSAPFPGRIFMPPYADPMSSNINPLMLRWLSVTGMTIAAYLDEHGMPGSMHQEGSYDAWYAGYLDNVGNFRHTLSFYTETALYRYATPHFYSLDDFPAAKQSLRAEMLYSSPWKGGWWRLADACRYMQGASMAVLNMAAEYREQLVYNKYKAARDTIEQYEKDPPYAYLIPREQHDSPTAALMLEKLILHGLEVKQSADPDAWVVMMNQPFSGLAKELFEPQKYLSSRRPPDVTGWTLPYQMGVEVHAMTTPPSAKFKDSLKPVPMKGGSIVGYTAPFSHAENASLHAVNEILAAKGAVSFAGDEISATGIDKGKLDSILAANHLRPTPAKGEGKPVKAARIGLYRSWNANMDEGWTRWILEQYQFPFASLYNADVIGGHLREKYDVIVIPDSQTRQIMEGFRAGTIPERYAGGIGEEGVDALKDFV